jgi:hypothetical protein
MSRACPRSGPHIDFPRGYARHVPGFAMPLAEFTAHCPEVATTRSTAAYALESPVCPTEQTLSCAARAASRSRAAWQLPRLTTDVGGSELQLP